MHSKIIEDATLEQLKKFAYDTFDMLKRVTDEKTYDDIEIELYQDVYGCHFNKWLLEKALRELKNEDGTTGPHWTLDQTTSVAKNNGIEFTNFNEYDWCYVMNMIYSDYYGAIPNDLSMYIKLSKKFLDDKDAGRGKAFKYYTTIA